MFQFWLSVLLPVALGSLCIALMNVCRRGLFKKKKLSALQFLILGYSLATAFCGAVYVSSWGFTLPPKLLSGFWTAVFCGTAANFVIQFLNAKAASLPKGEVSLTAPLQAMTPGLITGLALLLREYPSRVGIFGVLLMICGSYVLLWEKTPEHWYDYFGPIRRLRYLFILKHLSPEERQKTIVVSLALGSATMGTVGLLFDGLYTRRGVDFQGIFLAVTSMMGLLTITYLIWYLLRPDARGDERKGWVKAVLTSRPLWLLLAGFVIFWSLHWMLIQPTYNKAFVAYVGTLKRFSILMSVILGYLFFHEAEFKQRLWAAVLIVAGAFFISLDDLPTRLSTQLEILGF